MPSTSDSRAIKITASSGNVTVSEFNVNFAANFTTSSAVVLTLSDESDKDTDKTIHALEFTDAATGQTVASVSIRVKAQANLVNDFAADIAIDSRPDTSPTPSGPASQLRNPTNSNLRKWAQPVAGATGNVLRNVAVVDARSTSGTGTAAQSVVTNDDGSFQMSVTVSSRAGTLASGTIDLTTAATPGAGYSLGKIVITDTEDDGPAARTVIRR